MPSSSIPVRIFRLLAPAVFMLAAGPALAHAGHPSADFGAGLAHPLSGLDHLLAMIAVGWWASQQSTARWALPAAFLAAMAAGAAGGVIGWPLPDVEPGIAASVAVLGLAVALAVRTRIGVAATLVSICAVLHGVVHGIELPADTAPLAYGCGFLFSSAMLLIAGLALGAALDGRLRRTAAWLVRTPVGMVSRCLRH